MSEPEYTIDLDEAMAHAPFLRRVARALVGDEEAAEDLLQETWIAALEHPPRRGGRLRAWLAVVLRRKAQNRRRAEARRLRREPEVARPEAMGESEMDLQLEVQRQVFEQVFLLDEPYRSTIHLRFYEGLPPGEIARRQGVPVKTVKTRLHRALATLRERLDREHRGNRGAWMAALIPFAVPGPQTLAPAPLLAGTLVMKKLALLASLLVLAIALVVGVPRLASWWSSSGGLGGEDSVGPAFVALSPGSPQIVDEARSAFEPRVEREALDAVVSGEGVAGGSILVTVLWSGGEPASGIGVQAQFRGPGLARLQTRFKKTDREGIVRFEPIAAGEAKIKLDRETQLHSIDVEAGIEARLTVELAAGIELTGRVLSPGGDPVAGAELWMEPRNGTWPNFHLAGHADAGGRFRLRGLGSDTRIGARAPGYRPSHVVEAYYLTEGENKWQRVVELHLLEPGGGLRGRVIDPAGEPVAGATVVAGVPGGSMVDLASGVRAVRALPVRIETDAEGRFTYPGDLQAGATPVSVTAPGFPGWSQEILIVDGTVHELEVQLAPGARIDGRLLDADGLPVAAGKILVAKEFGGGWYHHQVPPPTATTGEDGRFTLEGIAPGAHELNASPVRAERARGKANWHFECSSGEQLSVELVLDVGLVIEGQVVDSEGLGVPDWAVRSSTRDATRFGDTWSSSYPRDAFTDAHGRFQLANLGEGGHDLSLAPAGFYGSALARVYDVPAGTVGLVITIDRSQVPDATLSGTLDSIPSNAEVVIRAEGDDSAYFVDVDPDTGRFHHGPLTSGSYRLEVFRSQTSLHVGEFFELESGEYRDLGMIQLSPPGAVELRLTGELPDGFREWRVSADRPGCASAQLGFEDGSFVSRDLVEGRWLLRLWQEPYFMPDAWVEVVSGETLSLELEVRPGRERQVSCRFGSGEAAWKKLSVEVRDERGELMRAFPEIDRKRLRGGEITLHHLDLPDGEYSLRAWTDTGLEGRGERSYDGPTFDEDEWVIELR